MIWSTKTPTRSWSFRWDELPSEITSRLFILAIAAVAFLGLSLLLAAMEIQYLIFGNVVNAELLKFAQIRDQRANGTVLVRTNVEYRAPLAGVDTVGRTQFRGEWTPPIGMKPVLLPAEYVDYLGPDSLRLLEERQRWSLWLVGFSGALVIGSFAAFIPGYVVTSRKIRASPALRA